HSKNKLPGLIIMGHRATFPRSDPRSIIADERLNFCVRNGNRCFPLSINTPKRLGKTETCSAFASRCERSEAISWVASPPFGGSQLKFLTMHRANASYFLGQALFGQVIIKLSLTAN